MSPKLQTGTALAWPLNDWTELLLGVFSSRTPYALPLLVRILCAALRRLGQRIEVGEADTYPFV